MTFNKSEIIKSFFMPKTEYPYNLAITGNIVISDILTMHLGIRFLGIKIPDNNDTVKAIENPIHIAEVMDLYTNQYKA